MTKIEQFLTVVKACDGDQIEIEREHVTPADLETLAQAYWSLDSWQQKAALVNLAQDHINPLTREIMQDILQAPDSELENYFEMTKVIALCHLEEDFDRFMVYYNDRRRLDQAVQEFLPPAEPSRVKVEIPSQLPEIKVLAAKGSKRRNLALYAGVVVGILMGPIVLLASLMPDLIGQASSSDLGTMRIFGGIVTVLFGLVLYEQFNKLKKDARLMMVLDQDPEQLVWVYKEVRMGRAAAPFVHVYFHLADKTGSKVWLPELEADRLLSLVCQEFSQLSCGYSREMAQLYRQSPVQLQISPQRIDGVKRAASSVRYL